MSNYKRLTKWEHLNCASVKGSSPIDKDMANAINRLAELEDKIERGELVENKVVTYINMARSGNKTLVDKALKYDELKAKIENGTLIELPCTVGDVVYVINGNNKIEEVTVLDYTINKKGFVFEVVEEAILSKYYLFDFDFNKDWFLTKAEAEKKLKELQNER